jgi:hypothetical protein
MFFADEWGDGELGLPGMRCHGKFCEGDEFVFGRA